MASLVIEPVLGKRREIVIYDVIVCALKFVLSLEFLEKQE